MKKAINMEVGGLKCDAEGCDFIMELDISSNVKNYKSWINKPCPKCGAPLLTEADYSTMLKMQKLVKVVNFLTPGFLVKEPRAKVAIKMNGSGEVEFGEIEKVD